MPKITLPNTIDKSMLVDFTDFAVIDATTVNEQIVLKDLEASENLLKFLVQTENFTPYRHLAVDGTVKIGYNLTVETDGKGLTEQEAYSIFINNLKIAERKLKKLMPLDALTQSQYDALLSLYYKTSDFKKVGSVERKFYIYDFIKNNQWEYVATALINSNNDRNVRQQESKILMLGDYGKFTNESLEYVRQYTKAQSLKTLERRYPDNLLDPTAIKQAQHVYYTETSRFLPNMDQAQKQYIVKHST